MCAVARGQPSLSPDVVWEPRLSATVLPAALLGVKAASPLGPGSPLTAASWNRQAHLKGHVSNPPGPHTTHLPRQELRCQPCCAKPPSPSCPQPTSPPSHSPLAALWPGAAGAATRHPAHIHSGASTMYVWRHQAQSPSAAVTAPGHGSHHFLREGHRQQPGQAHRLRLRSRRLPSAIPNTNTN